MGKKFGLSEELQCEGMLSEEIRNNPKELIDYVENRSKLFKSKWALNLFYIMPFITIASTALFLFKYPISPYIPFLMFVIQGSLTAVGYFKAMPVLNKVFKFKSNIEAYQNIIKLIEKEDFETKLLSELKLDFVGLGKAASARLKSLERIVDAIDFRYNIFIYFILNLTLLWDYHCVFALEDWREANRESIKNWIKNIGTLEALSSLSVITQMDTQTCFPTFISKGLKINGIELGHPLILEANRVCNDIEISNNLCIVTGSNMSGKTTLLRTIGINLVLAYAGAPVFAKRFESSIMDIFTSMRIADDLNGGISTFYAELLRIKMIIEYSKKKLPMVFLVDELFRGTNSRDRVIGAKSMLTSLSQPWIIGLISTHDFELCSLDHEKNTNIVNYHFTESYKDNKIHFDYKLLPGRCNTTNAKYLMKMVGIDLIE
jgi:DNA mismatch repair ATPase MutS